MYKPDHIWVEFQVPIHVARDLTSDNTSIKLFIHGTSTPQVEFSGHLERKLPLPDDQKVKLRISTAPPASLVRKLAFGEEVQAQVSIRSKGFAIAGMIEQIPAFLLARHFSLPQVGVSFVPPIVSVCLFIITITTLRNRRTIPKEVVMNNLKNDSLIINNNGYSKNNESSYTHSYTDISKSSDLPKERGFVYHFTNDSSDIHVAPLDISRQEVHQTIEDMVSIQVQRIVEEHKKMTNQLSM